MLTTESTPQTLNKKLVAVVSEKLEPGTAMNALAHISLGMGTLLGPDEALMCNYLDANGISHSSISAYPFIILKGRPGKIREAIEMAKAQNIQVVDFTSTMTIGTYVEQLAKTKNTANQDLEFYAAVLYGDSTAVSEITKKFSLFR